MPPIEHPAITSINILGYPSKLLKQSEHSGIDFFGDEILEGDEICEYDEEIILKENLERFLKKELGFEFKTAI